MEQITMYLASASRYNQSQLHSTIYIYTHRRHVVALPMVILEISYCTTVTSKCEDLALQVGGVSDETVK
jgi:hypothetical protein